ncbi:MAG: oligosaccharide flippase family protein [Candidatus Pristimantibacillus sp.]
MAVVQLIRRKDSLGNIMRIFASNVFILGLNTLTGIIIARYLGPSGRGEQAVMIMWPQFLAYMLTLGLPSSIVYYIKKREENEGSIYMTAMIMSSILGSIAILCGLFIIPGRMDGYSEEVVDFAKWALLLAPFSLFGLINNAVLQARDEYSLFNRIRYIPNIITLILLLGLVLSDQINPFYTSMAYLLPQVPITLWTMYRMLLIYKKKWKVDYRSAKGLTGYGIRSYGTDLAGTLSSYIDQVLVVSLLSPSSLGLYVVALSLSKMLNMIQSAVVSVLFPEASGLEKRDAIMFTLRVFRISFALTLLLGLVALLLAPYLLPLLYGGEFISAVNVLKILIIQVIISSSAGTLAQGFMATGKPGRVTILQFMSLGLNAALLVVLVPNMGIMGAALSLLITNLINFLAIMVIYKIENNLSFSQFYLDKSEMIWMWNKLAKTKKYTSVDQ